jgi:hypothetical protein
MLLSNQSIHKTKEKNNLISFSKIINKINNYEYNERAIKRKTLWRGTAVGMCTEWTLITNYMGSIGQ